MAWGPGDRPTHKPLLSRARARYVVLSGWCAIWRPLPRWGLILIGLKTLSKGVLKWTSLFTPKLSRMGCRNLHRHLGSRGGCRNVSISTHFDPFWDLKRGSKRGSKWGPKWTPFWRPPDGLSGDPPKGYPNGASNGPIPSIPPKGVFGRGPNEVPKGVQKGPNWVI